MICIVQRSFEGSEGKFVPGQRVDTAEWRQANVESLVRNRFMTPIAMAPKKKPVEEEVRAVVEVKKQKRVLA
jgi:hypothetical protein